MLLAGGNSSAWTCPQTTAAAVPWATLGRLVSVGTAQPCRQGLPQPRPCPPAAYRRSPKAVELLQMGDPGMSLHALRLCWEEPVIISYPLTLPGRG